MQAIQTAGLTKYYGRVRGIDGLDLTVEEGAFFGFIGPNGAGKSTTFRTLLGLIRPTGGSARVLGLDVLREKRTILENVGYLPAETAFWPGMRVGEVLALSAGFRRRDCAREAKRLCARLDLDVRRRTEDLSLGNRKKAAIVCALQHRPRLLLLDEPTAGLDPLVQREFFSLLQERNRAGTTVFLSSHVLSEVQRWCGQAAVLRDGRLAAQGRVGALAGAGTRRVSLRGRADLSRLGGVRDLQEADGAVSFLYGGSAEALVRCLAAGQVTDLTVTEPDLEEIFLHYYGEGGGRA